MAVRHRETGIVHSGSKGGTTGCGISTRENPGNWSNTSSQITFNLSYYFFTSFDLILSF